MGIGAKKVMIEERDDSINNCKTKNDRGFSDTGLLYILQKLQPWELDFNCLPKVFIWKINSDKYNNKMLYQYQFCS